MKTSISNTTISGDTAIQGASGQDRTSPTLRPAHSRALRAAMILCLSAGALLSPSLLSAQVPAVVATSAYNVTTSGTVGAGQSVVDSCGNVYVWQTGTPAGLIEIAAGTGAVTLVSGNNQGYQAAPGLAINTAKSSLYFQPTSQWYSDNFSALPITNCSPGSPAAYDNNALYSQSIYYFGVVLNLAVDGAGNVFFVPNGYNGPDGGEILEYTAAGNSAIVQSSWPHSIGSLAADGSGNIYFNDGTANIYQIRPGATAGTFTAAAVFATGFTAITGLSFDPKGDLYVADSGSSSVASAVYEVPLESTGLNPAHQYEVAPISLADNVSVDAYGNIFTANYSGNLVEERVGSAVLPSTAVGLTSASQTITYTFNSSVTPATISVDSGTAASGAFAISGGTCAANTTYTAGQTCTVTVTFSPSITGLQTGVVVLANSAGAAISTTTVSGIGLGAAATIDPGSLTQLGLGFKTPQAVTVDSVGNVFVADAGTSTITEFPVGVNAGVVLSTGTITLSAPNGIAVDAAGDIFIADTGNNRIIEIPVVNGALSTGSTFALTVGLSSPNGIAFDAVGNLYIADTGNKRGVAIVNRNGALDFTTPLAFGTGLSAPSAVTVDPSGTVYLADAGTSQVVKFTQPAGGAAQITVVSGLSAPSGLATDASGSLYVVDKGNSVVDRYPNVGGNLGTKTIVSSGIASPYGVASDASGNLYITDNLNALVEQEARVQTSLQFGGWNIGTTSTSLDATVSSSGNQALTLGSPSYTVGGSTTAGFAITGNTCTAGASIATGSSCDLTADFTPPVQELSAEEDLTFASNATNGTAKLALVGTGAQLTTTTLALAQTSPASGVALTAGEAVAFTATLSAGSNPPTSSGNVKFYVNGSLAGTVNIASNVAVLSLPNGLPKGAVTITATYSGFLQGDGGDTGSTASITATVIPLTTTLTLAVTTPYNNPPSVTDSPSAATGPSIPLTATVAIPGQIIPGGTVSFYAGSTLLGISSVGAAGGGVYDASITTTALRAGTTTQVENGSFQSNYAITAVYTGDQIYTGSTSAAEPVTVVGPPATQAACATAPQMKIVSTALSGGVATFGYTASSDPAAGEIVTITGTTNGGGILNLVRAVIASVNTTAKTFTVAGLSSTATYASATEAGTAGPTCFPNATGATYALTPSNLAITVPPSPSGESSGSAVLAVNSYGGWSGILNFSCSGLPQYATCSPYPGTPLITASTPAATLTPTQLQFFIKTNVPPLVPTGSELSWWFGGLGGLLLLVMRRRMGRFGSVRLLSAVIASVLLGGPLLGLSGCGSGTSSSPSAYATPKGTSTVTVTVSGAQLVPGTTVNATELPDSTTSTFKITLTVQ